MKKCMLVAAVLALTVASSARADDKQERAKFNGKWVAVALTGDGMEIPADMLKKVPWYWIIDDKKILSKRPTGGGRVREETINFTIDPTKSPKTIDITDRERKETHKGIYELKGDTLTICFVMRAGAERPDDLTSKKGSKRMLLKWQRVKE